MQIYPKRCSHLISLLSAQIPLLNALQDNGPDMLAMYDRCRADIEYWCLQAFLRQWNASLHIWLLTYIYKPLGGRSNPLRNTFIVFTFVATWLRLEMLTVVIAVLATLVYKCEQVRFFLQKLEISYYSPNLELQSVRRFILLSYLSWPHSIWKECNSYSYGNFQQMPRLLEGFSSSVLVHMKLCSCSHDSFIW